MAPRIWLAFPYHPNLTVPNINWTLLAGDLAHSELEKEGQIWAVLIAGSMGWMDYRHQADVCHSYQVGSVINLI